MSRTELPSALIIAASPGKQHLSSDFNPNFAQSPRSRPLITRIRETLGSPVKIRMSMTPPEIAVNSVLLLLSQAQQGLSTLEQDIPGLERLSRQLVELAV